MSLKGLLSSRSNGTARGALPPAASAMTDGERLAMLDDLEQSGLGWFWASDVSGQLTYLSAAIAARLDVPLDALIGQPLTSIFTAADREGRAKSLPLMLGAHKGFVGMAVRAVRQPEGAVLRLSGQPVFAADGSFAGFRGTGTDITEEFYREEETARLARYDSLTGLSNRHRMAHQIEATLTAFKAARRNCAVMMIDLDRFKHVNDTLGHAAGDELLKQVATRLTRAIDRECEIGRLGGDEFQVMIPDLDDRGVLGEIAQKIITMLRQPYSLEEGRCVIGASVGIAIAPHDGVTRDEIVRAADLALYASKNGGRGQYRFFSGELENETIFRRRLEQDLGTALREEQLFLRFEPIVATANGSVCALEAHVCWNHAQRGVIDEEEFAQIVEGSASLPDVGRWAIAAVCERAAAWPETVRVAVNVPVALFLADDFLETVAAAIDSAGITPARLELEISEAVFFGDTNIVDRTLAALFKLGVRLTLDEFGSGYSSLAYLRRAPFDAIKIDEKLVAEAERHDSRELGLVRAIVALAGALQMDTIANGIESASLVAALSECGVRFLEGPIFSEPLDAEAVTQEMAGGAWKIDPGSDRTRRARRRTVFRKIQVIHDDYAYEVTLRNLSKSGALIQGLADVPKGTQFVVDLGGGQLAVATVTRSNGDVQGLEFEQSLIEDGSGGLCTRNRVSPYALAAAGTPLAALAPGKLAGMDQGGAIPKFGYAAPSA
ncbi:putative bifunctional diguanylate cyclase/phosphodiesterase [Erythrobacter sp. BLCC-B19]|uniref:putative bifunctional diguanylate cyclase/phosphodiesterase n=1 Tax=Erythrobacter sp. BLCC-B19 TaxID=3025315 RepID=UPI0023630B40|nr:EAL domain-containing protein [Erythrobacter sp. BLCC-B19]WDA40458.1 EAL domain-containing protein [Erythrobacter sp. BLCC-B19]